MVWACAVGRGQAVVGSGDLRSGECWATVDRGTRTEVVEEDCRARGLNRGVPWIVVDD